MISTNTRLDKFWQGLLSDPSRWRDHRLHKLYPRFLDSNHKNTQESFLLQSTWKPPWIEGKVASIGPGTFKLGVFVRNRSFAKGDPEQDGKRLENESSGGITGRKKSPEELWQQFFSDPSQWRDHRLDKVNPRFPDFKHKKTQEALWLDSQSKPPWVEANLAAIAPGIFEVSPFSWNQKLSRYTKTGQHEKTISLFRQMKLDGIKSNNFTFGPVLKACASLGLPEEGRHIHAQIIRDGYESDLYLGSSLIDMYAKCGSIEDAHAVFNKMPKHDVVSWSAMIRGYVKCGEGQKALELSRRMLQEGVDPDCVTFVGMLNACASVTALDEGRQIHEKIMQKGYESDLFVGSSLVDMYAKCGSIIDARTVFERMPNRNVVSWSAMIVGYVRCGQGWKALELSRRMLQEGVDPDCISFVGMLNACASVGVLEEGRHIHERIIEKGYDNDVFVGNSLVDMYAKCGSIEDAWIVFNKMPSHDVVSWSAIILGYVRCGNGEKALKLSQQMQEEGVDPDCLTFVGMLNACASVGALEEGRLIHEKIIQKDYENDLFVGSSLVDMYAKCGSIQDAWQAFNKLPTRNLVSWNSIILGYLNCGQGQRALELFHQMQDEGVDPDSVTFVGMLNACASVGALDEGRLVHEKIIQEGYASDSFIGSSLVGMYAKCGSIEDAWKAFIEMPSRNVFSWNSIILAYLNCGDGPRALELSYQMQNEGVVPDSATFVGMLNACASLGALEEGRAIHEKIIRKGFECDVFVGSCLVNMYAKCGSIEDAWIVFSKMPYRNVVSWSTMILGYVKCGEGQKALELSHQMQDEGVDPNPVVFVAMLNACASIAALEEGTHIHEKIIQRGYETDPYVASSLIDMYAKCGSIENARIVFIKTPTHNVFLWNAMLRGYAEHGHGIEALRHFLRMRQEGIDVDEVTFVCLLSACSHGGLVDEGLHFFDSFSAVYSVAPTMQHYSCMVDLLGRAGQLQEADDLIKTMSCEPSLFVWMSLLSTCRIHGNVELGELASKRVLELDPENSAVHVLLSNMYSAAGQWECSIDVREQMLKRKVLKEPECHWINSECTYL